MEDAGKLSSSMMMNVMMMALHSRACIMRKLRDTLNIEMMGWESANPTRAVTERERRSRSGMPVTDDARVAGKSVRLPF
jgi:hypothetical protein